LKVEDPEAIEEKSLLLAFSIVKRPTGPKNVLMAEDNSRHGDRRCSRIISTQSPTPPPGAFSRVYLTCSFAKRRQRPVGGSITWSMFSMGGEGAETTGID